MFADDTAIFTEPVAEATDILSNIARVMQSSGLNINSNKTKVLATDGLQTIVHLNRTASWDSQQDWSGYHSLRFTQVLNVEKKKTYPSRSSPFYGDIDTALLRHVQVLGLPNAMFVKNPGSFPIHNHFQIKTTPLKYEQHPTIEEKNQRQRFGHVCRVNASRLPYRLFCSQLPTQWKVLWSAPK